MDVGWRRELQPDRAQRERRGGEAVGGIALDDRDFAAEIGIGGQEVGDGAADGAAPNDCNITGFGHGISPDSYWRPEPVYPLTRRPGNPNSLRDLSHVSNIALWRVEGGKNGSQGKVGTHNGKPPRH